MEALICPRKPVSYVTLTDNIKYVFGLLRLVPSGYCYILGQIGLYSLYCCGIECYGIHSYGCGGDSCTSARGSFDVGIYLLAPCAWTSGRGKELNTKPIHVKVDALPEATCVEYSTRTPRN